MFTARNRDDESSRKGIEAVLESRPGKSISLTATYTYTDATEEDASGQDMAEVRRPRHMASVSANYYFAGDRGNLNLNLEYRGSQQDVFFSPVTFTSEQVKLDSYTVLDLAGSWKLTPSLDVIGRISNLTDESYEEVLGFTRPERAFYAGLRGRFEL
jgi:vitamin B12 transporter